MRVAWLVLASLVVGCSAAPGGPEATGETEEAIQQCENGSVEGVDVSNGQGTIDWAAVKAAGVDFAIMKATQGTYYTASTFPGNWSGTKAHGVYRSAYHFFDPTEDGAAQAAHFLSIVGTIGPGDLPAMLDIECPTGSADTTCLGNGQSDAATAAEIATRMWAFIHAVEQATGKKPLIYTYGSYFTSNGVDTTGLDAYPLYIADPVTGTCFNVPAPWTSAIIWQYSWTGTVSGITGQVDRDRFIGTLAGLGQLAGGGASGDAGADGGKGADAGQGVDAGAGGDAGAGADAGTSPDASAGTGPDAAFADAPSGGGGGCGCRVTTPASPVPASASAAAALFVLIARRKRRRSCAPGTTCQC
ncbi:MAG TPA: GH25 family lysozyme [Polyangiaceae bacterium]|jgi:lysozyme